MELEGNIFSPLIEAEAKAVINLTQMILDVKNGNNDKIVTNLLLSPFLHSKERTIQLVHIIYTVLDCSADKVSILANFFVKISLSLGDEDLNQLKTCFIQGFIKSKTNQTMNHFACYQFILLAIEEKLLDAKAVVAEIKLCYEYLSHQTDLHFDLLMWFGHLIYQNDQDLFNSMTIKIANMTKSHYPKEANKAYQNFLLMEKTKDFSDLIFITKNRYRKNSVPFLLKNDMLNEFCVESSSKGFSQNNNTKISFYEPNKMLHKHVPTIAFAAFYGSIKVFKKLYLDFQENVIALSELQKPLIYYAISGGNYEIIRLIYQTVGVLNSPKYATFFYQNKVFEWLKEIEGANFQSVMHTSCKANNVEILVYCIKQNYNINEIIKGNAPIHLAAINGHSDCLRILISREDIDINLVNMNGVFYFISFYCFTFSSY